MPICPPTLVDTNLISFVFCSLYEIFPARAPVANSTELLAINANLTVAAGDGRTATMQAGMQVVALVVTMVIAIVGGVLTGKETAWHAAHVSKYWYYFPRELERNKSPFRCYFYFIIKINNWHPLLMLPGICLESGDPNESFL